LENDNTQFPEKYGWTLKVGVFILWPLVAISTTLFIVATWLFTWAMIPSSLITTDMDVDENGKSMMRELKVVFPWQFIPSIIFTRNDRGGLEVFLDSVL
jgi:hypothetical protein